VADDNLFILGFLYYHWLSFCCHGSYLHKAFTSFFYCLCLFVLWVVSTCTLICLVLLMDMWCLWFLYTSFQGFSFHQWLPHMIPFDRIKFCDLIVYVHLLTIAWIGLDVCTNVIHYHILFQLGPYPLHKIQMEHNQWKIDLRWSLKPMVVQGSFMCLVAMGHLYNDRGRQWNPKYGHDCWYTH
jgi:hypothetical protein